MASVLAHEIEHRAPYSSVCGWQRSDLHKPPEELKAHAEGRLHECTARGRGAVRESADARSVQARGECHADVLEVCHKDEPPSRLARGKRMVVVRQGQHVPHEELVQDWCFTQQNERACTHSPPATAVARLRSRAKTLL